MKLREVRRDTRGQKGQQNRPISEDRRMVHSRHSLDEYDPGLVELLENLTNYPNASEIGAELNNGEEVDLEFIESALQILMNCDLSEKRFANIRKKILILSSRFASADQSVRASVQRAELRNVLECRKQQLKKLDQDYVLKRQLRSQRLDALNQLQGEQRRLICDMPTFYTIARASSVDGQESASSAIDRNENSSARERQLFHHRGCYICKRRFVDLHHFYDQLCPACAELNWAKRNFRTDLTGKVFLLTGARVKIGFECCKRLLECNATVLATSRFPMDCARRFSELPEFESFQHRLHIFGIDLRDLKSTIRLTERILSQYHRLDGIINNAAQTVRRPPVYYEHLMDIESNPAKYLQPESLALVNNFNAVSNLAIVQQSADEVAVTESFSSCVTMSASSSQIALLVVDLDQNNYFPKHQYDVNQQQLDLRPYNSWTLLCHEVSPVELIEVFAVNALSPFILNSRLKPLLKATDGNTFVINVSAMEGKFYRFKGPQHPHTNMAKAALNMLTRTSAQDFVEDHIFMNSVDTGWINDENPFEKCVENAKRRFSTPIDEMDAMARILDPILDGVANGVLPYGKFLKDYQETEW